MSSPIIKLPQVPKDLDPELRDYLLNINKILIKKQNEDYGENEKIVQRVIDLLYPIGERYIQLPEPDGTFSSAKSPEVKFGGEWACIFDEEGVFFRTEGYDGQIRSNGLSADQFQGFKPSLTVYGYTGGAKDANHNNLTKPACLLTTNISGSFSNFSLIDDGNGEPRKGSRTEPVNRLMRIWERVA